MPKSRRSFFGRISAGLIAFAAACRKSPAPSAESTPGTPGAPPAFGTAPEVGPPVTPATFIEAEKLVQFPLTTPDREVAARTWRSNLAALYERRTGPRKYSLDASIAPATVWNPTLPGQKPAPAHDRFIRTKNDPGPLPSSDADIAFAPVTQLSRWIESRKLTSERLTNIYLDRLQRFDPKLRCVITLTKDLALAQAKQADQEIAAGHYRGPLHGIPWGAKDLVDTAGIPTTYGAEPFRNRLPDARRRRGQTPPRRRCRARGQAQHWVHSRSTTSGSAARP